MKPRILRANGPPVDPGSPNISPLGGAAEQQRLPVRACKLERNNQALQVPEPAPKPKTSLKKQVIDSHRTQYQRYNSPQRQKMDLGMNL